MSDYLTTADIAREFGVQQRTVTERWTKRPDFPRPARRVNRRLVWWLRDDVLRWASQPGGNAG